MFLFIRFLSYLCVCRCNSDCVCVRLVWVWMYVFMGCSYAFVHLSDCISVQCGVDVFGCV